jgi:hypothetical protein
MPHDATLAAKFLDHFKRRFGFKSPASHCENQQRVRSRHSWSKFAQRESANTGTGHPHAACVSNGRSLQ